jgi:peptide deformylase
MSTIVTKGHPALSAVSTPVRTQLLPDTLIDNIISQMKGAVTKYGGVGLAANQIGNTIRIIVINTQKTQLSLINPVITRTWGEKVPSHEECLSFPGLKATMMRYKAVQVEGHRPDGSPFRRKFTGLDAIVVQHEIDHLDGVTIDDTADN